MLQIIRLVPLLFGLMLAPIIPANAQELIGTAGSDGGGASVILDESIGEVVVETNTNGIITQGYQQPNLTVTGVEDNGLNADILVYPNPTSSRLNIEMETSSTSIDLKLLDSNGQLLWQSTQSNKPFHQVDLSSFANGVYHLIIVDGDKRQAHRIVKS